MGVLKRIVLAIGALAGLLIVAAVAAWLLVDPNDYKDRIAQGVKSSTGRDLGLPGDIRLSVFPWLALELGPASLGNPPGFGDVPFATVQHAKLRMRLMPLLRGELQVGRIEIDGLDLRLARDASGKGNWEDFGQEDTPDGDAATASSTQKIELAGVVVRSSQVAFEDLVASRLTLDIGAVSPGKPIAISLQASLVTKSGAMPMPLALSTVLTPDFAADRYRLDALTLSGSLPPDAGSATGTAALPWRFAAAKLDLDLAAQTLAAPTFDADIGSAQVAGDLAGTKIIDAPALQGHFALQPVVARNLLRESGNPPPVTRDATVLQSLEAKGQFDYAGSTLSATGLVVQLDDSKLTGRAGRDLDSGAVTFDLALDRIDLDRYLPPPTADAAATKSAPFELPVDALKPLRARGSLAIDDLRLAGLELAQLRIGIDAADGLTRIAPARAQLYGGQYTGEISIDTRPATPRLTLEQTMSGIDVATLMKDFLDTRRLAGRGTVTTKLVADGRNSDALTRTLTGKVTADLADGAVEGIDVWHAIAQAQSLLKNRELADVKDTKRTAFETFHASADVAAGVATTRDLVIASRLLRITGTGNTNLPTGAVDYELSAAILKEAPGAGADLAELARMSIPVKVTGTLDDPKLRPDLAGLARARVRQEVDKRKEQIEEKVKDRLKGLFNR